jgi:hypothetical protein
MFISCRAFCSKHYLPDVHAQNIAARTVESCRAKKSKFRYAKVSKQAAVPVQPVLRVRNARAVSPAHVTKFVQETALLPFFPQQKAAAIAQDYCADFTPGSGCARESAAVQHFVLMAITF